VTNFRFACAGYRNNPDAEILAVSDVDPVLAEKKRRDWGANRVLC